MYNYIINNFRGTFIVVITRSGNVAFGEVVDGTISRGPVIPLLSGITQYVNADAIDFFF
ncbi:MAG: hypothetical protein ACRC2K_01345 [Clostridium sp.]